MILIRQQIKWVTLLSDYPLTINPTELIPAKLKGEVAQHNNTFNLSDVERLRTKPLTESPRSTGFREDFHKEIP
jgi:hypothetical protein